MNRKETTELLSELLRTSKFTGIGKYYAREVTIDYATKDVCRVDYMQFLPPSQSSVSDLEKGIFICYEIKSCIGDFKSGHGQNFIGEENYFVMTMDLYKKVKDEIPYDVGVLVAVPSRLGRKSSEIYKEFENPTEFKGPLDKWKLHKIKPAFVSRRSKSLQELLFCMLRSGK